MTRETILKKALDMASHNLYCCSKNLLMTIPKDGQEKEHAEAAAEVELLDTWLKEITNAPAEDRAGSADRFEGDEFAMQIMANGRFEDNGTGGDKSYTVEATTLRLNHVALNEWLETKTFDSRECYADGPDGDAEWKGVQERCKARRSAFDERIKAALGIKPDKGVFIEQAHSEVFTVVNIYEALSRRN